MHFHRHLLRILLLIGVLTGRITGLSGQPASYVYLHLDRENGLASNQVLAILQDHRGVFWFGTDNGLQRYDGRLYFLYRHQPDNLNSLASDIVEALLEDREHNLWAASSEGVTRLTRLTQQFQRFPIVGKQSNRSLRGLQLLQNESGEIGLISRVTGETFRYEPQQKAFVLNQRRFASPQYPDPNTIPSLKLWKSNEPYTVLKDHRGITWAIGDQMLVQYPGSKQMVPVPKKRTIRYGIDYNQLFCLTEDREGTLWLGTDKGIYTFNPDKQQFFSPANLPARSDQPLMVTGFLETASGEIWVSTFNQGIWVFDARFRYLRNYPVQPKAAQNLKLWCLLEDGQGSVWAGGDNGILIQINAATGKQRCWQPPLLTGQIILEGALDSDGSLWWGTDQGCLVRFNPRDQSFSPLVGSDTAVTQHGGPIKRILFGSRNDLWVATGQGGVFQLDKNQGRLLSRYATDTAPHALLSNEIGEMQWYTTETLAVATRSGLHFIDLKGKTVKAFTTAQGLPGNAILNLMTSSNGPFFLSTQHSFSSWNPRNHQLINYGAREGILHPSFAYSTSYRLRDGRVVVGTLEDFFYFHPDSLARREIPPDVVFTGFKLFHQPMRADSILQAGKLHLRHWQNYFTLEYASLQYYDQDKITYSFQLEGVDPDWVRGGHSRMATYTNLGGGDYRFKVRAELAGTPTRHITVFPIHVDQPFWQTTWFMALVALGLVVLGYGLYRLRVNRLLALHQVRTRIARDLHDDMGSTLSTINILSSVAQEQTPDNAPKTKELLEKISGYSQRMLEAMDDIVWSINPANDAMQNMTARMQEFGTELAEARNLHFQLEVDAAARNLRLPLEARHDVYLIFKEAFNNAAKYAQARQITVRMGIQRNRLSLQIQDDGQGFLPAAVPEGNGLENMRKRAQALKGELDIISQPGQGTTVRLTAPIH